MVIWNHLRVKNILITFFIKKVSNTCFKTFSLDGATLGAWAAWAEWVLEGMAT
jgi:hypothetical protein